MILQMIEYIFYHIFIFMFLYNFNFNIIILQICFSDLYSFIIKLKNKKMYSIVYINNRVI